MTDRPRIETDPVQRRAILELTEADIDQILPDLPGGQSVSPAMRRLHVQLREARSQLVREAAEEQLVVEEPSRPALQLVQEPVRRRFRVEHRIVWLDPSEEQEA